MRMLTLIALLLANPAVTNPAVTNPAVTNPAVTNPAVTNPAVTNPAVTNPALASPTVVHPMADPIADLGKALFFDPNLSINGTQSCVSCHDPAAGCAASGLAVMPRALGTFGTRKPPTAAYAFASPPFHHVMEDGAPLFLGGLFHDGRATGAVTGLPLADQASGPLLNPVEMALPNPACAVQRACQASGLAGAEPAACDALKALSPCDAQVDPDVSRAFTRMTRALAAYEASPEVSPFASRYDAYVAGTGSLTSDELFGLTLFTDKAKCAGCRVPGTTCSATNWAATARQSGW